MQNITDEVSRSLDKSRELLKQAGKTLSKVPGTVDACVRVIAL